ncbi:MBL fold metallo-hydrolase [Ornithinicoccus halotolerans]|uniref:MBL fold metallo-hydrolase n=1 Tax=Ornithinicoccus halotolerans TaxID=1748220 RepID=UPI00129555F5|nr:MBL fold metallo-hydrolase [Ornithinicoccus halotolerans]
MSRLTVVGCAGSFPGPQSPASCYLLTAEHEGRTWRVALDLGNGALGALQRYADPRELDAVVLSHLHPDHCLDLTSLKVVLNHAPGSGGTPGADRLPVHGPAGTAERLARAYGVAAAEDVTDVYDVREVADREPFEVGPFRITPVRVEHPVTAYGYRVLAPHGRTLAYTGDTDSCPALAPLLRDADLALMDAAFLEDRDTGRGVHLTARRAAQAAVEADVRRLLLTHIPAWNDREATRAEAARVWPGEVELAEPGGAYDW